MGLVTSIWRKKWRVFFLAILALYVGRLMEPIVEDWLEDKSCSIGDVTREEYEKIMEKAEEVYRRSRWMTIIDKDTEKVVRWNPVKYPEDSAVHLTLGSGPIKLLGKAI